jgi:DNA-binding transcriptional ArsR family regulator
MEKVIHLDENMEKKKKEIFESLPREKRVEIIKREAENLLIDKIRLGLSKNKKYKGKDLGISKEQFIELKNKNKWV